ncbi:MAG: hypothetical protein IT324_19515 [Anaerolineae bacterium]|nr:hypothetical protein [Anaerolineae bacterium]
MRKQEHPGVAWNSQDERWMAYIRRDGKQISLGTYADKALAIAIREEAEQTPTNALPALKAKYRALREANKNGDARPYPDHYDPAAMQRAIDAIRDDVDDPELARQLDGMKALARLDAALMPPADEAVIDTGLPDAAGLQQKLAAALAADERFQRIKVQYCAAERDALEAWNEYARELAAAGRSDVFARSYLGFLREEIKRS